MLWQGDCFVGDMKYLILVLAGVMLVGCASLPDRVISSSYKGETEQEVADQYGHPNAIALVADHPSQHKLTYNDYPHVCTFVMENESVSSFECHHQGADMRETPANREVSTVTETPPPTPPRERTADEYAREDQMRQRVADANRNSSGKQFARAMGAILSGAGQRSNQAPATIQAPVNCMTTYSGGIASTTCY